MSDARRVPGARVRAHPASAVRPDPRLRPDQPPAAVPARRPQPPPVAERDREGAVVDPAGRAQPGDDEGVRSRGRHLSRQAARGHLDRRGRVPGRARRRRHRGIAVASCIRIPSPNQIFARIREGKPLGNLGVDLQSTAPSEANIVVPVVDHDSGGTADEVEQILSDAGFDISPGVVDYATYGADVKGSVIAYKPGHQSDAEVVQKYFPNLQLLEVPATRCEAARSRCSSRRASTCSRSAAATAQHRLHRPEPRRPDARAGPGGRRGVAAAAAHPHQREAADPRRGRADPVPCAARRSATPASPRSAS